jgi:hypothetical protein
MIRLRPVRLSPQARVVCVLLSVFWLILAAAHVTAWIQGNSVEPVSLVLSVVSGIAGVFGLLVFALGWRR